MGRNRRVRSPPAVVGRGGCLPREQRRFPRRERGFVFVRVPQSPGARSGLLRRPALLASHFIDGFRDAVFLSGLSPPLKRGEWDEAVAVFVPSRPQGAERVGVI